MHAFPLLYCAVIEMFLAENYRFVTGDRIAEFVELSRMNQQDSEARRRLPKDYFDFYVNDTEESAPTDFYAGLPNKPVRCGGGGSVFSIAAVNSAPVIASVTIRMPERCFAHTSVQVGKCLVVRVVPTTSCNGPFDCRPGRARAV